jgi:hypothetical protein
MQTLIRKTITVWVQRQLESRTTASASVVQEPGAVQTEIGKFKGSSCACVPTFCAKAVVKRQQPQRANIKARIL